MADLLAPDQGAAAQLDQGGLLAQPDTGSALQPAPSPEVAAPVEPVTLSQPASAASTPTKTPEPADIDALKASPTEWPKFEQYFGTLPKDFQKPIAQPEDVAALKASNDDPKVVNAYEKTFGSLPFGAVPGRDIDDASRVFASSAMRVTAAMAAGGPPTAEDMRKGGAGLVQRAADRATQFKKDMEDPNQNWQDNLKSVGSAFVAAGEEAGGIVSSAVGSNPLMRFTDFVRANLKQTQDDQVALQNKLKTLPPDQAQDYMNKLTGGQLSPNTLRNVPLLQAQKGWSPTSAVGDAVKKGADSLNAVADDWENGVSPAAKKALEETMVSPNKGELLGPGATDPRAAILHASQMFGTIAPLMVLGDGAGTIGFGLGRAAAVESLADVEMPIIAKEAAIAKMAGETSVKAAYGANAIAAGHGFGEMSAQQVAKQVDQMDEKDLMKIPEYKAVIDNKGTTEQAKIAASHNAQVIAYMSGAIASGLDIKYVQDGFGSAMENMEKVVTARAGATAGAAGVMAGTVVKSAAGGAVMMGGTTAGQNIATGQDVTKGVGESAAQGAAMGLSTAVAGHAVAGAAALGKSGVDAMRGKATEQSTPSSGTDPSAQKQLTGPGSDTTTPAPSPKSSQTHADLQSVARGEELPPEAIKALKDQGLISTGSTSGKPMVLPAGKRFITDFQQTLKQSAAESASAKGQPGTDESKNAPETTPNKMDANEVKVQDTGPKVTEEADTATKAPRTPDETKDEAGVAADQQLTKKQQMDKMQESRDAEIQSHMGSKREEDYPLALNQKGEQDSTQASYEPQNRAMTTMQDAMEMTQKSQTQVRETIPRATSLSSSDRNIESRFIDSISSNLPAAIKKYSQLPQTDGGRIINTDEVRQLSADYAGDHSVTAAVHEPSSWLAGVMYKRALAQPAPPGKDNVVVMTAGGTGSGKTSGLDLAHMDPITRRAQIVFDTAMNSFETGKDKIAAARNAGKGVIIHYVYRDPLQSFAEGSLPRSMDMGRVVPIEAVKGTHEGSSKAIKKLMVHFKDDPMVQFVATHNEGNGKAVAIDPSEAVKLKSKVSLEILRSAAKEALKNGTITPELYARTTGQLAPGTAATVGSKGADGSIRSAGSDVGVSEGGAGSEGEGSETSRANLDRIEARAKRRFAEEKARRTTANRLQLVPRSGASPAEEQLTSNWTDLSNSLAKPGTSLTKAIEQSGMGAHQLLDGMVAASEGLAPEVKGVMELLREHVPDVRVSIVPSIIGRGGEKLTNADGMYSPVDGHVQVTKRIINKPAGPRVLAHELFHAAMAREIEENPGSPHVVALADLLDEARDLAGTKYGHEVVADHVEYFNSTEGTAIKPKNYNRNLYGLTDILEMTAETTTSPAFQRLLDHLDNEVRKTLSMDDPYRMMMSQGDYEGLVQRIVNGITDIFGPRNSRETRLLQDIIYHTAGVMKDQKARMSTGQMLSKDALSVKDDLSNQSGDETSKTMDHTHTLLKSGRTDMIKGHDHEWFPETQRTGKGGTGEDTHTHGLGEDRKNAEGKMIADDLGKNKISKLVLGAAELGALKLIRGVVKYEEWAPAMSKQFGRSIKPVLPQLFEIAKDKTRDIKSLVYKKGKDGRYVGGPAGLGRDDLATLRATVRKLAREGGDFRNWYDESSQAVLDAVGGDIAEAKKLAGLLSIFSSGATVSANTTMALRAWYQHQNGVAIDTGTTANDEVAQRWLDLGKEPDGMKKSNFYGNLLQKLQGDHSDVWHGGVTVDRWMMRALGYAKEAPTDPQYAFISDQIRKVAKDLGWEPEEAQAAVWVAIKARWEDIRKEGHAEAMKNGWISLGKDSQGNPETNILDPERYYGMMLKRSLAYALPKESLARAGANYRTELVKQRGQVSWEALPSSESGKLPGMEHMPIEVQAAFQHDAAAALINPKTGNDHLRESLGMLSVGHIDGNSAWFNNPGQVMRFRHWSTQSDLSTVDPKFMGKGVSTWAERGRTNKVTALYPYETNEEQPEKLVASGAPHQYVAEIPAQLLYDASRDPLGFREAAMEPIGFDGNGPTDFSYNHDEFEKGVKAHGYLGYYGSDAGEDKLMQGQARLFKPWPVTPVDKYVNFDGYSKAGSQEIIYAPMTKGAAKLKGSVPIDPNARAILESYAASIAMLNHQNSVGWHRPRTDSLVRDENGMAVHLTNASSDSFLRAYKAVSDAAKSAGVPAERAMEFAPIHSPEGFRFVNWGAMDNNEFKKTVSAAIASVLPDAVLTPFAADGGLISNDWTTHKNGEQYAQVIAKNGHSTDLAEPIAAVKQRLEGVYSKYAERLGTEHGKRGSVEGSADSDGKLGPPISLDRLTGDKGGLQKDVRGRFGKLGTDLQPAGKLYDLKSLVENPAQIADFAKRLGFDIELFSFTSDPSKGIEFRLPKLGKNGYTGGKLWLYDPRVGAASFHDADYTRAWRISHELGHALTEHFMQAKYGDSFRYGLLGQTMQVERGGAGKQKMVNQRPLTLLEAQRAVEWEDVAFRMQRAVLEKNGVSIPDQDFAREYNTNISDAVYRVLTGDFTDMDGLTPSDKLPDLQSVLQLLEDSEGTLAKSQGREPSVGFNLRAWSPISDADIKAALENRMSGGGKVKFSARDESDYEVVAKTKVGDEVEGPHNELTFSSNEDAHDYVDSHDLPPGANHFLVRPVNRNPFQRTPRAKDGKAPSSAMKAEFVSKYPLVGKSVPGYGQLEERLVNGNVIVGMVTDPYDAGTVYLSIVRSLEPGQGAGTKALADIAGLADKHGVAMELNASPLDTDGIRIEPLIRWYEKMGFKQGTTESMSEGSPDWNAGLMRREPQDPAKFSVTPFETNEGKGLSDEDAAKVLAHAQAMFPTAHHHLAKSIEDAPHAVQAEAELRGISDKIMAAYVRDYDGTHIYLIQNNMTSPEEALDTLVQENVGHDGIARTFGDEMGNIMDGFLRNGSLMPSILRMAAREGIDLKAASDPVSRMEALRAATEEWLAHGAGAELAGAAAPTGLRGAVGTALSHLKLWAAGKGLPITLDRDDALVALRRAHDYVKSGAWTNRIQEARDAKEAASVKFAVVPPDPESIKRQNAKMGEQPKGPNTEGYKTRVTRAVADARSKWLIESADQLYRIKQYEEEGQIPPAESGYISARLSTNVMPQIRTLMEWGGIKWTGTVGFDPDKSMAPDIDTSVKPLNQIHAPLGNDPQMLRNFEWYQYGLRANDLMKEGRENSLTKEDIADALSYAVKYPHFVQMQKDIAKLNKNVLDFAERAGIINPETRPLWESENYTPLYRVAEEAQHGPFASGALGSVKNPITRLKGGTQNVRDITGNMVQNWKVLISAATKAHAARVAIDNLTPHGLAIRQPDMVDAVMSPEGINAALEKAGIEPVGASSMAGVKFLLSMHQATTGADTITIWRGGKRENWQMVDPLLAQSFAALKNSPLASLSNVTGLKTVMGLFGGAKRGLTAAIVHTPIFWLRTLYKDNINAWVVSRGIMPVTPIVSAIAGTIKAVIANPSFRRMSAAGASFNQGRNDPSDLKVGRKKYLTKQSWVGRQWQNYLNLTSSSENASRVTVYENTLKKTSSHKLAAFEARDIMDYAMRGASPLVHAIVETVPFWGAHSQGMYKTGRAMVSNSGSYAPTLGKKIVGRVAMHSLDTMYAASLIKGGALAFLAAAAAFHNFNNPAYQELPDLQKESSFNVYVGNHRFMVPKQFESGQIFGTFPEAIVTAALSNNKATVAKEQALYAYHAFANLLNLNPTPQLVKPLAELYGNSDWANNGNPILTSFDQELAPSEQVGPRTSPTITAIARHMPIGGWLQSPKQLDFLVRAYTGMLGTYVLQATDLGMRAAHMAPKSPDDIWRQLPVVSSFMPGTGGEPYTTRSLQELNKVMKAAAPIEASIRELEGERTEESVERAKALMDADPEQYVAVHDMRNTAKWIHEHQKMQRKAMLDAEMSDAEKKAYLNESQKGINQAAHDIHEYRPGGTENKTRVEDMLKNATSMNDKAAILRANDMPHTASLLAQLGKKMPPAVQAALEELA